MIVGWVVSALQKRNGKTSRIWFGPFGWETEFRRSLIFNTEPHATELSKKFVDKWPDREIQVLPIEISITE
jgi:hypothetical protein